MDKKLSLMVVALSTAVLGTGCSIFGGDDKPAPEDCCNNSVEIDPAVEHKLAVEKIERITREDTVSYYYDERRSAAIVAGGYKHTLGVNNYNFKSDEYSDNVKYDLSKRYKDFKGLNSLSDEMAVPVSALFTPSKKVKDYSYYELGRWQRLCGGLNGESMDKKDWAFVRYNRKAFPADLLDSCRLPAGDVLAKHGFKVPKQYLTSGYDEQQNSQRVVIPMIVKDHTPSNQPFTVPVKEKPQVAKTVAPKVPEFSIETYITSTDKAQSEFPKSAPKYYSLTPPEPKKLEEAKEANEPQEKKAEVKSDVRIESFVPATLHKTAPVASEKAKNTISASAKQEPVEQIKAQAPLNLD